MRARPLAVLALAVVALVGLAGTTLAACGDDTETVSLYDRRPVPAVPDRTMPADALPADGQYWAVSVTADGDRLRFDVGQAFFGPACVQELGADACIDEPGLADEPTAAIDVAAADLTSASVVAADRRNFAVTGEELLALVGGDDPAAEAPDDFTYVDYPYLLTLAGGSVTVANQIWVP